MRKREEIENQEISKFEVKASSSDKLIVELLLDIRELLTKK